MKTILLTLTYTLIFMSGFGQQIRWEENYGGSSEDELRQFFQTSDMGYLAIGYSNSNSDQVDPLICNPSTSRDAWIVKLTSSGGQISWKKSVGGESFDYAYDAVEVSDGFVMAGQTFSDECDLVNESPGGWIFKLDNAGNLSWSYAYNPTAQPTWIPQMNRIEKKSTNDGFLLGGNYQDGAIPNVWLMDTDNFGSQSSFEILIPNRELIDLKVLPDGGYLLGGMARNYCQNCLCDGNLIDIYTTNIWFRKYDSTFNLIWDTEYGDLDEDDVIQAFEIEDDNTFSAVGYSNQCYVPEFNNNHNRSPSLSVLPSGIWGIDFGNDGTIQNTFSRSFNVGYYNTHRYGTKMQKTTNGYYFISRSNGFEKCIDPTAKNENWYWVIKTNQDFTVDRYMAYGGSNSDIPYSIDALDDGGFIIAGTSSSSDGDVSANFGARDYWVIELDSFVPSEYCYANAHTYEIDLMNPLLTYSNRIRRFVFQEIDNSGVVDTGYNNFTHMVATAEPGTSPVMSLYNVDASPTAGVAYVGENYGVWIDWNHDGDFIDTLEETIFPVYYDSVNLFSSVTHQPILIPADAPLEDSFRMRIGIFPEGIVPDPCLLCFLGEYEDYTLVMDLIAEIDCYYQGFGALACNYQHAAYPYDDFDNVGSSVEDYGNCITGLTGSENCWELYPGQTHGEMTVTMEIVDNIDLDLIVLDKLNEQTGVVACSQTIGAGTTEEVTFQIDSSVQTYYVIVDGYTGATGTYFIRTDCTPNDYCEAGNTNDQFLVSGFLIDCDTLQTICDYPFYINKIALNPAQDVPIQINLVDDPNYNNGLPPVKSFLRLWIDENNDGDFSDAGEKIVDTFWMNAYSFSADFDFSSIAGGKYNLQYQVATFNYDIEFNDDPCIFWFQGAISCYGELTILNNTSLPCASKGCTLCPGGERTYLNQASFQGTVLYSDNDGGYADYSMFSEIIAQNGNLTVDISAYACSGDNVYYSVFIDFWDGASLGSPNGIFNDLFEQYSGTNNFFTIPLNAIPPGSYPMRLMIESYSGSTPLVDPCKLNFPGETEDYTLIICPTNDTCDALPLNNFIGRQNRGLPALSVNFRPFYDNLYVNSGVMDTSAYSYDWIFPGGTPNTSNLKAPAISYSSPGFYNVTLNVSNNAGTRSLTKNAYVEVYGNNNCPNTIIVNDNPIGSGAYIASDTICSSGRVQAGGDVIFSSGNTTILKADFEAELGAVLEINSDGCP